MTVFTTTHCGPRPGLPDTLQVVYFDSAARTNPVDMTNGATFDGNTWDTIWIGVDHSNSDIERVFFFWDPEGPVGAYHEEVSFQPWSLPGFLRGDVTGPPYDMLGGPSGGSANGLPLGLDPVEVVNDPRGSDRLGSYTANGSHRLVILIGLTDKTYHFHQCTVTLTNAGNATTITPGVPTGLGATVATDNEIVVSWTASANADYYEVGLGATSSADDSLNVASAVSWTSGFIATGATRYARVRAVSSTGTPSAWSAVAGPYTITGPTAGTTTSRVPIFSGTNAFMKSATQKGPNYIVGDPNGIDYSTVTSDVLWPRWGGDWAFFTKDAPEKWANGTRAAIAESVSKYTNNNASKFIRNIQYATAGGWGATSQGFDSNANFMATISLMAAPTKLNSKPYNNNGQRIYNNRLTAIELAKMYDGFYDDDIRAIAQVIATSTDGGLSEGEWAKRVIVSLFNECNAPWFANYTGIDPLLVGDSVLLNPTSGNVGVTLSAEAQQLLVDLATAGDPAYEVLGHPPDTSLDSDPYNRQEAYGVGTDQGLGGDRSVLSAATYNHMVDVLWSVHPDIIPNPNFAHSGANPEGTSGEGENELSRKINARFLRLIAAEGSGRIAMFDVDWYCRAGLSPRANGATDWQDYDINNPGGLGEAIEEAEAFMTQFDVPFGSREYGYCRKLNPAGGGVGCQDKQSAKMLDYLENPSTGLFNSSDFPVGIIYPYNAKNQPQANRNIRYNFNETLDPITWEVLKTCRPGRGEAPSDYPA